MDPLVIAAVVGLALMYLLSRGPGKPPRGSRTLKLGPAIACRLSPEDQRKRAIERNLVYQRIEEQARAEGEIGPELFGRRIAAITSLPQSNRRDQAMAGEA